MAFKLDALLAGLAQGMQWRQQQEAYRQQQGELKRQQDEQARLRKKALEDDIRDAQWQMAQSGIIPRAEDNGDVSAMLRAGSVAPRSSNPLAAAPIESAIANLGKYVNADQIGPSPKWGLINGMQYTDPIGPVNSDPNRLPSASYLQPATPQVPMAPPVAPRPPQPAGANRPAYTPKVGDILGGVPITAAQSNAPIHFKTHKGKGVYDTSVSTSPRQQIETLLQKGLIVAWRKPNGKNDIESEHLHIVDPSMADPAEVARLRKQARTDKRVFLPTPRKAIPPSSLAARPAPATPSPAPASPAAPPLDILSLFSGIQQQTPAVSLPQPTGRFSQETEEARKIYEAMRSGEISERYGKSLLAALKFIPERQQEYLIDGKPVMLSDSDYKALVINANNIAANAPYKQAQTLNALVGANFSYIKSLLYSDEVAATIAQKAASKQLDLSRIPFEQLRPILEAEKIAIGRQNANTARAGQQSTAAHQRVMQGQGQQRIAQGQQRIEIAKTRGGANPDQGGRVKYLLEQFKDADKKQPGIGTWDRLSSLIRRARGHGERSSIKTAFIYSGLPIRAPGGGPSEVQEFVDTNMRGSAAQVMPKVREWYYNGVAQGIPDAILQKQIIRRLKSGAE